MRFVTWVVEATCKGAVPVVAVETSCAAVTFPVIVMFPETFGKVWPEGNVMIPALFMERPVSVGLLVPEPNSRFSVPDGPDVLLAAGSACHRKVWGTEAPVPLLNDEAVKFRVWEVVPFADVAGPVAGKPTAPLR